jgi:uncharacterized protein (TIGR02099 family)
MFKVIENIGTKIPKALAFFIILIGSMAFCARIFIPLIEFKTDFFSNHVSAFSGYPTSIKQVRYSWAGWTPTLTFQKLDIIDAPNGTPLIHFPKMEIQISSIQSLLNRNLIPKSITFEKLNISFVRDELGKIRVKGMPPPKFPIFGWLLSLEQFNLVDGTFEIHDEVARQKITLTDLNATSFHDKEHQIYGSASLAEGLPQNLKFSIHSNSTIEKGIQDGEILIRAKSLDSQKLLSFFNLPLQIEQTQKFDFEGKSIWKNSNLSSIDFSVRGHSAPNAVLKGMDIKGRLSRLDSIWEMNIARISIPQISSSKTTNATNFSWNQERLLNKDINFSAQQFDAALAIYLASLSKDMPLSMKKILEQTNPRGSIENIIGRYQPDHSDSPFIVSLGVKNLSTKESDKYPALKGISANVRISLTEGELKLMETDFTLSGHQHLTNPLVFRTVKGSFGWKKNKKGNWDVSIGDISGGLNSSPFNISGYYNDLFSDEAYLNIGIALPNISTQSLKEFLPLSILPPKGESWIQELFQEGRLTQGTLAFRGHTKNFPFRNLEGTFVADFEVSESTIKYARFWPIASEVNGHIAIREDNLYFSANNLIIEEMPLTNIKISGKKLFNKEKLLHIAADVIAPGGFPTKLVQASPLLTTPARQITRFVLEDDIEVHLDMTIPLLPGAIKEISGSAIFSKNKVSLNATDISLTELTGSLFLKEGEWWTDGLEGILDETPVKLYAKGGKKTDLYATEIDIRGNSTVENLLFSLNKHSPVFTKWLVAKNFSASTKGNLDWETVIKIPKNLSLTQDQKFTGQFEFRSNLVGVESTLPMPISKSPLEEKQFSVELEIEDGKLARGFIDLFEGKNASPMVKTNHEKLNQGLLIRGSFYKLEIDAWMNFLKEDKPRSKGIKKVPLLFDFRTEATELFGHHFNNMHIKGLQTKKGWDITLDGIDASGKIILPLSGSADALDIRLRHLRLIKNKEKSEHIQSEKFELEPKDFPSLAIHVDKLMYHGIELGETAIAASKVGNELVFNMLTSETEDARINATGRWAATNEGQTSAFEFVAAGDSASNFLRQFGYQGTNIKGGKTNFSAKINWPGSPSSLKFENLNGTMQVALTDGRIKNIDPGSGRIFGLLGLQSLPRRLSLDFNDLFKKGFAFDSIAGDFEITQGYAYTENLITIGPSAQIAIKGTTGLASHDYDQVATVTPSLSGSIPVASALLGPVGIGAGAIYYLSGKIFKSIPEKIDKLLTQEYSITGTWDVPLITKIKSKK